MNHFITKLLSLSKIRKRHPITEGEIVFRSLASDKAPILLQVSPCLGSCMQPDEITGSPKQTRKRQERIRGTGREEESMGKKQGEGVNISRLYMCINMVH